MSEINPRCRLDKWLWAARFFRTRSQAKEAIDGGKVAIGETRPIATKAAKEVGAGDVLHIRRGDELFVVRVTGVAERRGSASDAALLYDETAVSRAAREAARAARPRPGFGTIAPPTRPTKRDRRVIDRLHASQSDE